MIQDECRKEIDKLIMTLVSEVSLETLSSTLTVVTQVSPDQLITALSRICEHSVFKDIYIIGLTMLLIKKLEIKNAAATN